MRPNSNTLLKKSLKAYPEKLRRVKFKDPDTGKEITLLTNNFDLPPLIIAQLYKKRWQIELFFKWIKQNLHIESFYGQSENAVKLQVWVAICAYLLIALLKKRLGFKENLYEILHFLDDVLVEQTPIQSFFLKSNCKTTDHDLSNQLSIEGFLTGH